MHSNSPLLLCQDFLGHRTHAQLLHEYIGRDGGFVARQVRFSVDDYGVLKRTAYRALGYKMRNSFVRQRGLDGWAARSILVQSSLARAAANLEEANLLYVHSHTAGRVVRYVDQKVPFILSLDGTYIAEARMDGKQRISVVDRAATLLERSMFQRADLIVSFSDWARESVVNDYGIPIEKTVTIRNAVQPISLTDSVSSLIPDKGLPIIGFVGNDITRKGGDVLLKAHQDYLSNQAHLVMVTRDVVDTKGMSNVTLIRPIARDALLSSIVPKFDIFVHPARKDWSPYSVIEALAVGLPVVATPVGSIPEMIEDGVNGLLLGTLSPHCLSEAISRILSDSLTAANMSSASRAKFEARYNAEVNYPELIALIKGMAP